MMIRLLIGEATYYLDDYVDESSIVYSDNIDTTMAHGGFSIPFIKPNVMAGLDMSKPLPRLSKIILTIDGMDFYYLISEDKVNKVRKGTNPLYSHEITLIEPTVLLTLRPIPDMTVTQPKGALTNHIYAVHKMTDEDMATGIEFDDVPVTVTFDYGVSNDETVIEDNTLKEVREYEVLLNYEIVNPQYETLGVDSPQATFNVEVYSGATLIETFTHTIGGARFMSFNRQLYTDRTTYTPSGVESLTVKVRTTTLVNSSAPDTIYLAKMGFTLLTYDDEAVTPKMTLAEVVDKILLIEQSAPLAFPSQEFTLDAQSRERLYDMSPEFTFRNYTMYDALSEIASYVGAVVYLADFDTVQFHFFDDVADEEGITYLEEEQNVFLNDYVTGLEINASNVISEDSPKYMKVEPSETGWLSVRAQGIGQITDANATLHITRTYKAHQLLVKGLAFSMKDELDQTVNFADTLEWDISQFVVEQTKWNALENVSSANSRSGLLNKGNTLYYAQGEGYIYNIGYNDVILAPAWNTATPANYAVVEAILCKAQLDNPTYTFTSNYTPTASVFDLRFRVYHMPYVNARVTVYRDDAALLNKAVRYFNETANINDMKSLGDIARRHVNQRGNVLARYKGFAPNIYNLLRLGMRNARGEVLTSYSVAVSPVMREFVLDYSKENPNISAYKGIPSAYRQYEVPMTDMVYRKDKYTEFVYLSENSEASTYSIYDTAQLLANFKPVPTGTKVTFAQVFLDFDGNGYTETVEATVDTLAFGTTSALQIEMKDNYSAGAKQVEGVVVGNVTQQRQADAPYVDEFGRVENIKILVHQTHSMDSDAYPDNDDTVANPESQLELKVLKDAREIWGITQELVFRSNYSNIKIFSGMAKYNGLVMDGDNVMAQPFLLKKGYFPNDTLDLSKLVQTAWDSTVIGDELYTEFTAPVNEYEGYVWVELSKMEPIFAVRTDAFDGGGTVNHSVFISTSYGQMIPNRLVVLTDAMDLIETSDFSQFIFPIADLTDTLSVSSTVSGYQSTDYVVDVTSSFDLSETIALEQSTDYVEDFTDTLSVNSTVVEGQFVFPILDFTDSMSISETMVVEKSTDYVLDWTDTLSVNSYVSSFNSDDYALNLGGSFDIIDSITLEKSTDYVFTMTGSFSVTDSISLEKSTDYVITLSDGLIVTSSITPIQSTDHVATVSSSFDVSDSITLEKSTDYAITLSDSLSLSSTLVSNRYSSNWAYIGTSGTYNKQVTHISSGSTCGTTNAIDTWLEANYPATDYDVGYVIRVVRGNEDFVPCSPSAYYYIAS